MREGERMEWLVGGYTAEGNGRLYRRRVVARGEVCVSVALKQTPDVISRSLDCITGMGVSGWVSVHVIIA